MEMKIAKFFTRLMHLCECADVQNSVAAAVIKCLLHKNSQDLNKCISSQWYM